MARPQRIEYEGAVYHVTVRGNERRAIFQDDADRERFLRVLGESVERFDVDCEYIRKIEGTTNVEMFEQTTYPASRGNKVPSDIRMVACALYMQGFFLLLIGLLLFGGFTKPQSRRVLFGSVLVTNRQTDSIYRIVTGASSLVCGYCLTRRGLKFAWWFSLIWFVESVPDVVFVLCATPNHRVGNIFCVVLDILLIAWLWFRRDFYNVRIGGG